MPSATIERMSWKPEVDQLHRRRELALELGGEEAVKKQHDRGRLTVRDTPIS